MFLFAKPSDAGDRKHATKKLNLYKTFSLAAEFWILGPSLLLLNFHDASFG